MPVSPMILGTRGSDLARVQTAQVKAALETAHSHLRCREKIIQTVGDQQQHLKLTAFSEAKIVDKGIFTKDLEIALHGKLIDVAVHSLKDVPTEIDPAFTIAAVLPREDTSDWLVTKTKATRLADLPPGARVATSSVRRQAQALFLRPDLAMEDIRGNVPTRLGKLRAHNGPDAVILAAAGIRRLGFVREEIGPAKMSASLEMDGRRLYVAPLAPPDFLPAASQGAIGLECRAADDEIIALLQSINHAPTMIRVTFERLVLAHLGAGCHTPVGIHTWLDGDRLGAHLRVFDETDLQKPPREGRCQGPADDLPTLVDQLMKQLYA